MLDAQAVGWIRDKYLTILPDLDGRGRRRWAAAESRSLGWGGITAVAMATGISDRIIRNGNRELDDPDALAPERQRKPGAGRRSREGEELSLIEALIEPVSRGDPHVAVKVDVQEPRVLADELQDQGFVVSSTKVGGLLKSQGYSLQSNRKTIEEKQYPDRNAQFEHIARCVKARQRCGEPAISVDNKKKNRWGTWKNRENRSSERSAHPGEDA